jgi:hypothetical protein
LNALAQTWLLQSAVIFLILGSVAAIVVGGMLVFRQEQLRNISTLMDRWISTRNFDHPLEKRISLDPWFYRHSQVTGIAILAGALFILYFFTFGMERAQTVAGLVHRFAYPIALAEVLIDALALIAILGALSAVLVSMFVLFRPSLLRGFEDQANQWLSLRKTMKPLEIPRDDLNRYVERHARLFGIFFMLGGLYVLVLLLIWMGRQS